MVLWWVLFIESDYKLLVRKSLSPLGWYVCGGMLVCLGCVDNVWFLSVF